MQTASLSRADTSLQLRQKCVDLSTRCHNRCLQAAMTHCLPGEGNGIHEARCDLLINCSDITQMTANFLLTNSEFQGDLCSLCAAVCTACANACDEVASLAECVAACRTCAAQCLELVRMVGQTAKSSSVR